MSSYAFINLGFSNILVIVSLLFCITASIYYGVVIYATFNYRAQSIPFNPTFHPPISLLKPICGIDSHAYETLASFCCQDYPDYEIIFVVQDLNDPAIAVVKQLINDFTETQIQLVINDRIIGLNPKISNLENAIEEVKHSILLISDSDIQVGSDYLTQIVQPLQDSAVGVVTCIYRCSPQGWIANFEALGIATELMPTFLVSRALEGVKFGIGATILLRRDVLDAIGGFSAIANYLADDFLLGNIPAKMGYRVVLSNYIVSHVLVAKRFSSFLQHQIRWHRGIMVTKPWGYVGLTFTFGTAASLLLLLATQGAIWGWIGLSIVWGIRLTMAWFVGIHTLQDPTVKKFLWLVPLSDLVRVALWGYSILGDTVEWRGQQYKLAKNGELIALTINPANSS